MLSEFMTVSFFQAGGDANPPKSTEIKVSSVSLMCNEKRLRAQRVTTNETGKMGKERHFRRILGKRPGVVAHRWLVFRLG